MRGTGHHDVMVDARRGIKKPPTAILAAMEATGIEHGANRTRRGAP